MKGKTEKRLYVELRWSEDKLWHVVNRATQRVVVLNGRRLEFFMRKDEDAIPAAREYARRYADRKGPVELVVYNKNGRIAKNTHGRTTYGNDPRRTRG